MRKERFLNSSGIELKNHYGEAKPGKFPFTSGIHENMYRSQLWTMRQYAGFGSAKESNERYQLLLKSGTTGLSVAFDLPTQMGYDSDHVMATGEVGKVGVAISSIEDMRILFDKIPLDKVSTSMTINSTAAILLALYAAVAEERGIKRANLRGTIQNDLLKEYIARGTYIYPPKPSLRIITDIFEYCAKEMPKWNTISISGYHIREAGATAVQEIAFTLANAITYVEAAQARGLDVDEFGERLSFFFNVQNNLFEEVAKFRAARTLWAKIMRERFKSTNERAQKLRFHSQTAGASLTAQQPENNIVRVSLQALAAVLGGTQSLHTNSMDEALGLPTEKSAKIAVRTQQILAYETGVADVVDPLAGSYYVEELTKKLSESTLSIIERIESLGGVIACIESGWIQNEIQNSAYRMYKEIEAKEHVIVGVNDFTESSSLQPEVLKISESTARDQIERLKAFKAKRNQKLIDSQLENIKAQAYTQNNLMPHILSAVRAGCTVGEISDALRSVFGLYKEKITL
jgi:methylmalonyl-CoA mutase N-terminal domain/subunit